MANSNIPLRFQFTGSAVTSVAEYQSGESIPLLYGGTGATTAGGARTNLGLGSAATRNALGSTGELYSRDSILGAVSQAAGVPTGAIFESGSNANGEYIRFANGWQICSLNRIDIGVVISNSYHGLFRANSIAWVYPAAFAAIPCVVVNPASLSAIAAQPVTIGIGYTNYVYITGVNESAADRTISIEAIGRWF